jgi:hypothetical protein
MGGSRWQKNEKFYPLNPWKILNSGLAPFGAIDNSGNFIEPLKCQVQNIVSLEYHGTWNDLFETCKILLDSNRKWSTEQHHWTLKLDSEGFKYGFTHSTKETKKHESWEKLEPMSVAKVVYHPLYLMLSCPLTDVSKSLLPQSTLSLSNPHVHIPRVDLLQFIGLFSIEYTSRS